MRTGEIGNGPLWEAPGPQRKRIIRRLRGISLEIVAFVVVTILLPVLFLAALVVDLFLKIKDGKPMVGTRLVPFLWWFLFTEMWGYVFLLSIWAGTGGPFGRGSMRRRRGIYWLRPRWANGHLGGFRILFGLKFEIDGLQSASPGPAILMIRHASIVDNLLPDTQLALPLGLSLRYVIKRELEALPLIDIGGRWLTTNFLVRGATDSAAEIAKLARLTENIGDGELIAVFPEGTRATAKKIARAKEIVREKQPDVAPLAETMVNLLPPRLGGPLALLESGHGMDVIFFAHVGFDGYEYISDIWAGGLVGATIRMRVWRVPAAEIPAGERERIEWLYEHWQEADRWVGEQRAELGATLPANKAAGEVGSAA